MFEEGTRVVYTGGSRKDDPAYPYGLEGRIIKYESDGIHLVEFDVEFEEGHNGNGLGAYRRCWWCDCDNLELVAQDDAFEPVYGSIFDVLS